MVNLSIHQHLCQKNQSDREIFFLFHIVWDFIGFAMLCPKQAIPQHAECFVLRGLFRNRKTDRVHVFVQKQRYQKPS